MPTYAAFLRGINVGGHRRMRMQDLIRAFERLGFKRVKTLLASGNVLFLAPQSATNKLARKIEKALGKTFGHEIGVIVRTMGELRVLTEAAPFKSTRVTPMTRLFVTLLSEKPAARFAVPYASPNKSFRILRVTAKEVCSVLTLGKEWSKNLRQMNVLEERFGKKVTTRSWSTILRVLAAGIASAKK